MTSGKLGSVFAVCTLVSLATAIPTWSQAGYVTVWGDPELTACHVQDQQVGLVAIYVAHQWAGPTKGVRFRVDTGAALMVYLDEVSPYLTLGQPLTGVTVCYDACLESPGLIMTLHFLGQGFSPPCTFLEITEHPEDDYILALDCEDNVWTAGGGMMIVNQTSECLCEVGPGRVKTEGKAKTESSDFCYWVPVEKTTWGMIKSLYP